MYLAHRGGGYPAQAALWRLKDAERLAILELAAEQIHHMAALMDKYRDRPMDLADASLVAVAQSLSLNYIFTLDSDFHFYRLADGSTLEVIG